MQINQRNQIVLVLNFLVLSSLYVMQQVMEWPLLRYWQVRRTIDFGDLASIIRYGECYPKMGWDIYEVFQGRECANYLYGSWLIRILDFFNFKESYSIPIGYFALLLVSFLLSLIITQFSQDRILYNILGIAIAVSPPIQLLIERANIDWVIFSLVLMSIFCYFKSWKLTSVLIVAFTALIKFYTFPLLVLMIPFLRMRLKILFASAISILILFQILVDLRKSGSIAMGTWFATFGNVIWGKYISKFDINLDAWAQAIIGLSITLVLGMLFARYFSSKTSFIFTSTYSQFLAFCSAVVLLCCYFVGANFDYRLIWMIPTLSFLSFVETSWQKKFLVLSFFGSYWLTYNSGILQIAGDLFLNFWIVFCIYCVYHRIRKIWNVRFVGMPN